MANTVANLTRYPLKSAAKEELSTAIISPRGLELDREFMVTKFSDGAEHQFTQRDPGGDLMAQIRVSAREKDFVLNMVAMPELIIPKNGLVRETREVLVHSQKTHGIDQGDEASQWLNAVFGLHQGRNLRLVRQDETFVRMPSASFVTGVDARTAFADGYPILLVNQESFLEVKRRMGEKGFEIALDDLQDRMRANISVTGLGEAFIEDRIKLLRIGDGLILELVKPCSRCIIPSINQATSEKDPNGKALLASLASFRRGKHLDFTNKFPAMEADELNKTFFGMNAIVREIGSGVISKNDEIEVLEYR